MADTIQNLNNLPPVDEEVLPKPTQVTPGISIDKIPDDKRDAEGEDFRQGNYNSGKVLMSCLINDYCPFEKTVFCDQGLVFNSATVKSLPEYLQNYVSAVDGGPGIFLKERHFYHSQYLYINCEPLCPNVQGVSRVELPYTPGNPPEIPSTCSGCDKYWDNSTSKWYLVKNINGKLTYVDVNGNALNVTQEDAKCKGEYTWDLTKNVFMSSTDTILSPSQYLTQSSSSKIGSSRWSCGSINRPVGSGEGSGSDSFERQDSNVLMPTQIAASPTPSNGIHWRVKKRTRLFTGEDFFIELNRTTTSTDLNNVSGGSPFNNYLEDNDIYKAIDPYSATDGSNEGVVDYEKKDGVLVVAKSEAKQNEDAKSEKSIIKDSRENFDFRNQAYIMIEMGIGMNYRYFIIIAQKAPPRFVKVINKKSYCVSEYKAVLGSQLLGKDTLKIAVRNHLGRIIVKFTDYENNPWVIEDSPTEEQNKNLPFKSKSGASTSSTSTSTSASQSACGANNTQTQAQNNLNVNKTLQGANAASSYAQSLWGKMGSGLNKWTATFVSSWKIINGIVTDLTTNMTGSLNSISSSQANSIAFGGNSSVTPEANKAMGPTDPNPKDLEPGPLFVVPGAPIAIWGGNMPVGFLFSPIQYVSSFKLELPPPNKQELNDTGTIKRVPFVVPGSPQIVLSQRDMGLDKSSLQKDQSKADAAGGVHTANKNPFYTCDSQEVYEIRDKWLIKNNKSNTNVSSTGNSGEWVPPDKTLNKSSYFQDYGWFVKEKDMKHPSAIEIYVDGIVKEDNKQPEQPENQATGGVKEKTRSIRISASGTSQGLSEAKREADERALAAAGVDKKYLRSFYLSVELRAGGHTFESGCFLPNCKTPILTNLRLVGVPTKVDAWPAGGKNTIDASKHILSYSETWSAQDYNKMEHSANITFLINRSPDEAENPIWRQLESLKNKAFYVQIFAGYNGCNYSKIPNGKQDDPKTLCKMITGVCYGGQISEKAGERTLQCKIFDYTQVLRDMLLFNSPFFDGVRDINAVYEISKMAGFKEENPGDPLFLIKQFVDKTEKQDEWGGDAKALDGRNTVLSKVYALPSGYAILQGDAKFKFSDGSTLMSGLEQISQRSGKPLFFDADGMLHYEAFPIAKLVFGANLKNVQNAPNNGGGGGQAPNPQNADPNDVQATWYFTASPIEKGQMIFNALNREMAVTDVYNNIHVITTTPKQEYIMSDKINGKSFNDPTTEGFLGYMKTFLQKEGMFGSEEALKTYTDHLAKFFRPPVVFKFETFGEPLRCFDIANVDGQLLLVTSISQNIDAAQNKWWMNVEGEWLFGESGVVKT